MKKVWLSLMVLLGSGFSVLDASASREVRLSVCAPANQPADNEPNVDWSDRPCRESRCHQQRGGVPGAVIDAIDTSMASSCRTDSVGAVSDTPCGSTWHIPQMQGSSVTHVVVAPPR
jgi:hypothetical protein